MSSNNNLLHAQVKARREFAASLRIAGFTVDTIVQQVNARAASHHEWEGGVDKKTISKDLMVYFDEYAPPKSLAIDYSETMRRAHIAQMEKTIQDLVVLIAEKDQATKEPNSPHYKRWKSFEKAKTLEILHKAQMDLAEIHNWNLGRKNPLIAIQENNHFEIYEQASIETLKRGPEQLQHILKFLHQAKEAMLTKAIDVNEEELPENKNISKIKQLISKKQINNESIVDTATGRPDNDVDGQPIIDIDGDTPKVPEPPRPNPSGGVLHPSEDMEVSESFL